MAQGSAPIAGAGNAAVAALAAEVVADLTSDWFDHTQPGSDASAIAELADTDDEEVLRNIADDVRVAARRVLIDGGNLPPAGLTLRMRREGRSAVFYYGAPGRKVEAKWIGPDA